MARNRHGTNAPTQPLISSCTSSLTVAGKSAGERQGAMSATVADPGGCVKSRYSPVIERKTDRALEARRPVSVEAGAAFVTTLQADRQKIRRKSARRTQRP